MVRQRPTMTPDEAAAGVAQVDMIRDILIQLHEQLNGPHEGDDWAAVDRIMFELVNDLAVCYSEQMRLIFECFSRARLPKAIEIQLISESVKMTAMFSILKGHFGVVGQRGRGMEAHLHMNRITEKVKEDDAQFLHEVYGVKKPNRSDR